MAVPTFKGGGIANGTADADGGMKAPRQAKVGSGVAVPRRKRPQNIKGLKRGKTK